MVSVIGRDDFGAEATQQLVHRLRTQLVPRARFPAAAQVYVGGAPAEGADFLGRLYGAFPLVVGLMLVMAFAVLVWAFRSLLLPVLALVLDVLSVLASYGLVVIVFRGGLGADLFGMYRVSQVEGWVPMFLFAVLFGLSMDYQVFLLRRMRESWDLRHDHAQAVREGLVTTGRVLITAALVMAGALLGMLGGRVAGLQELGVGLASGAIVDATLVRALLLPALLALVGPAVWWSPSLRTGRSQGT